MDELVEAGLRDRKGWKIHYYGFDAGVAYDDLFAACGWLCLTQAPRGRRERSISHGFYWSAWIVLDQIFGF